MLIIGARGAGVGEGEGEGGGGLQQPKTHGL